jgi:hypothetical protein
MTAGEEADDGAGFGLESGEFGGMKVDSEVERVVSVPEDELHSVGWDWVRVYM